MNHFSADIETLGNKPYSVVLSIGICAFNPITGMIDEDGVNLTLNMEEQVEKGLRMDASTVIWWMHQSDEARQVFAPNGGCSLDFAYNQIKTYIDSHQPDPFQRFLWGNGATFDNVLLDCLFNVAGKPELWKFWNHRDVRTIVDIAGLDKKAYRLEGTHHKALDDAINQARMVVDGYRVVRNEIPTVD